MLYSKQMNSGTPVRVPGRATIPLGSNLGTLFTHTASPIGPSLSAPRNCGTKGGFRRLSGYVVIKCARLA